MTFLNPKHSALNQIKIKIKIFYIFSSSKQTVTNTKPKIARASTAKFGTEWRQFSQARASVSGDRRRHEQRARWHAEAILGVIKLRSLSVWSKSIRLCEVKSQALWMRNVARQSSDGDLGHDSRSNNRCRRSRS